jgi:hypothetical protein
MATDPTSALKHLRTSVLGEKVDDGIFAKVFEELGIEDIEDFMFIEPSQFKAPEIKLKVLQAQKLIVAQAWYRNQPTATISTWFELTTEGLSSFAAQGIHLKQAKPILQAPSTIPSDDSEPVASTPATTSSPSPAADFLRGIKRDVTQYQEFTDDKKWLLWKRHLKAMAPIHGLDCILDPDFKPENEAEKELFKQQQAFAFSIFSRCLKTSKSLKFLRDFEHSHDAHKLFHALVEAYEGGVTQELHEETVRDQLQKLQLNSTWNKTLESFLVTFEHKLLDLSEITKKPPSEEDKRKWLTAAIRGHEGLYQAANMSKVVLQSTGKDAHSLSYDYYYSMLLYQAKVLDQNAVDAKKAARKVNQAQQRKKKAKEKGTTAAAATAAPAQPKLAPNKGLPAGYDPEVKKIPDEIWPKLSPALKDAHFKKHKMGKYRPDYDPNNPRPWQNVQNRQANQTTVQAQPVAPIQVQAVSVPVQAQAPTPSPPGSVLKAILSNSTALQPTQTTVVAPAYRPPHLVPLSMIQMGVFIRVLRPRPTAPLSLQPNLQGH